MRLLPARLLVPARSSCSRLLPCLWKRQTNACHLVADKHASPPSKYSAPQSAQSIRRRSGTTETEPRAGAAPRPELLKPRGLDKWASFMHLIISDCSDRIECFAALLLCYSRQFSVVVVLLFRQAEVVNEKRRARKGRLRCERSTVALQCKMIAEYIGKSAIRMYLTSSTSIYMFSKHFASPICR